MVYLSQIHLPTPGPPNPWQPEPRASQSREWEQLEPRGNLRCERNTADQRLSFVWTNMYLQSVATVIGVEVERKANCQDSGLSSSSRISTWVQQRKLDSGPCNKRGVCFFSTSTMLSFQSRLPAGWMLTTVFDWGGWGEKYQGRVQDCNESESYIGASARINSYQINQRMA